MRHASAESIDRCGLVASFGRRISRGSYSQAAFWGSTTKTCSICVQPPDLGVPPRAQEITSPIILSLEGLAKILQHSKVPVEKFTEQQELNSLWFLVLRPLEGGTPNNSVAGPPTLPSCRSFWLIGKASSLWVRQIRSNLLIDHKQRRVNQLW